jgi:hypothetical protein
VQGVELIGNNDQERKFLGSSPRERLDFERVSNLHWRGRTRRDQHSRRDGIDTLVADNAKRTILQAAPKRKRSATHPNPNDEHPVSMVLVRHGKLTGEVNHTPFGVVAGNPTGGKPLNEFELVASVRQE